MIKNIQAFEIGKVESAHISHRTVDKKPW